MNQVTKSRGTSAVVATKQQFVVGLFRKRPPAKADARNFMKAFGQRKDAKATGCNRAKRLLLKCQKRNGAVSRAFVRDFLLNKQRLLVDF
jgi:hypothetical protein